MVARVRCPASRHRRRRGLRGREREALGQRRDDREVLRRRRLHTDGANAVPHGGSRGQRLELRTRRHHAHSAARLPRRGLRDGQRRERRDPPPDPLHLRRRHGRPDDEPFPQRGQPLPQRGGTRDTPSTTRPRTAAAATLDMHGERPERRRHGHIPGSLRHERLHRLRRHVDERRQRRSVHAGVHVQLHELCHDPDAVADTVLGTMGARPRPGVGIADSLLEFLRGKSLEQAGTPVDPGQIIDEPVAAVEELCTQLAHRSGGSTGPAPASRRRLSRWRARRSPAACGGYSSPATITGTDLQLAHLRERKLLPVRADRDRPGRKRRDPDGDADGRHHRAQRADTCLQRPLERQYTTTAWALYYRPSTGGAFTVEANGSTDAESAVKSGDAGYAFSTVTGFSGTTQTGNTLRVTFNGLSTGDGTFTVTRRTTRSLDSTDGIYSVTPDPTAPSGGGDGQRCGRDERRRSSYFTSGTSVAVRTIPTTTSARDGERGADGGVGHAGRRRMQRLRRGEHDQRLELRRKQRQLLRFTLTATDNVGNVATLTTTVKVDTTAPVAPTISFNGLSGGNTTTTARARSITAPRPRRVHGQRDRGLGSGDRYRRLHVLDAERLRLRDPEREQGRRHLRRHQHRRRTPDRRRLQPRRHLVHPGHGLPIVADSTVPTGGLISIDPYSKTLDVPSRRRPSSTQIPASRPTWSHARTRRRRLPERARRRLHGRDRRARRVRYRVGRRAVLRVHAHRHRPGRQFDTSRASS